MTKTALITGITGQTGSYIAEQLLECVDTNIVGVVRRTSTKNYGRISHLLNSPRLSLYELDIQDSSGVFNLIRKTQPDTLYSMAAQSFVAYSFENPISTFQINTIGTINLLDAVRLFSPHTRVVTAQTSEQYGDEGPTGQDSDTKFNPVSPYAVSKLACHHMVRIYREAYNLYICGLLMFNNESPRRGEEFVTRKITKYIGGLLHHKNSLEGAFDSNYPKLKLGNIKSFRDWSYSADMARAAIMCLEQEKPADYICCSEEAHSIEDFLEEAFNYVNLDWHKYVEIDAQFFRPKEVPFLRGDSSSIRKIGWRPSITFKELVHLMVDSDIHAAQEKTIPTT